MFAGVGQLHGVAELDPRPALGPVVASAASGVEHLGRGADLVTHAVVDPLEGVVDDVAHPLHVAPVLGVQLVVAPGVEDVLAVAVEGQVQHEVLLPRQQEVPHGPRLGLGECGWSAVRLLASVVTRSISSPVIAKISIQIHSFTFLQQIRSASF